MWRNDTRDIPRSTPAAQHRLRARLRRARQALRRQRDLLEGERARRRAAESANASKDQMLAVVCHELRTPLNAILGWTQLSRSPALRDQDRARALDVIERCARSQAMLIRDLLDQTKLDAGTLRMDVRRLDLGEVLEATVLCIRPAAAEKGVALELRRPAGPCAIAADELRLQQVFWNLIDNALKFTPRGGRVTVELRAVGEACEVAVSDTGSGIAPELLPRLFDRFVQGDAERTAARGLGLGLAIVRNLVHLQGGAVAVESGGRERGTTFTVTLPLTAACVPPAQLKARE